MKVEKLNYDDAIKEKNENLLVKVVEMGNITQVQYMSHRNMKKTVQHIDKDHFVQVSTGEIKEYNHKSVSRLDNSASILRSFRSLRALINTNITDVKKVRWCTLTYKENMQDSKRLYEDFSLFWKRFVYYCKSHEYGNPKYIVVPEPQKRGAWHMHLLILFDKLAPFICNEDFSHLWGHGFVKIGKLDNVDNVGAYLTAYLTDLEIDSEEYADSNVVKNVNNKKFIKGGRLHLYPVKFRIYRSSRGLKKPVIDYCCQKDVKEKVLGATRTFSKAIKLSDDSSEFETVIITDYYNSIRKNTQYENNQCDTCNHLDNSNCCKLCKNCISVSSDHKEVNSNCQKTSTAASAIFRKKQPEKEKETCVEKSVKSGEGGDFRA